MDLIINWKVFIHDKGMMVPGVLGKYGRAYDQLTSLTISEKLMMKGQGLQKISKSFGYVVSRVMTYYMEG